MFSGDDDFPERTDFSLNQPGHYEELDRYVRRLIAESTPEYTVWNVEKCLRHEASSWNYIDGCMITALIAMSEITGSREYFEFAESFIDAFILEDGSIRTYQADRHTLDDINEGRVLFDLYQATGKEKYRKAAEFLRNQLDHQPRTAEGSWWHKSIYPHQVWLDGLYMAQPFAALYETHFGTGDYSDILHQFAVVEQHMRDPKTGLYYHGYDCSRKAFWCDPDTGLSKSFWLRAVGWFSVALADLIEILPEGVSDPLKEQFRRLMTDVKAFADPETGMYYQVIDHPEIPVNYLETSGSAMIAYAMMKGARLNVLDAALGDLGAKTFDGIVKTCLSFKEGTLNLENICLVAGLGPEDNRRRDGTIGYYLSEPVVKNDAKGVAPLLLSYTEIKRRNS